MATYTPRVYAACLAAYNSGRLHGRWIDCDKGADHIREEIAAMLAESPEPSAEEWAFHDSEDMGSVSESADIDRLAEIGEAVAEAGDDASALLAWIAYDNSRDPSQFADAYRGEWNSVADYAESFADDVYGTERLGELARYIDWERFGRDMELGGDIESIDAHGGGVWIFDTNY